MEIEQIKMLIKKSLKGIPSRNRAIRKAELYYKNENDIMRKRNPLLDKAKDDSPSNPLRGSDNRICHPWYQLLVNQKTGYTMTIPPMFDVDDVKLNEEILLKLGNHFPKIAKDLCVNAGNAGVGWLHVWEDSDGEFKYAIVDSKQIIPIYSKRLGNKELEGLLRVYEDYNKDFEVIVIYEYWSETECITYQRLKSESIDDISEFKDFEVVDIGMEEAVSKTNEYKHSWGTIPFIPFYNNAAELSDLQSVKKLIDVYDKVFSGFVNDIDDIQEIIFVLTNYGGEDKEEFLNDLRSYKMVKIDSDHESKGSVETLAIDIPVEARNKLLEITRESIFVHGQGVDPQKSIGQNNSGAALKYMYSLLELKASMLETEFRIGFATLINFALQKNNVSSDKVIKQTWTRSSINNDNEKAEMVAKLSNCTSLENIAKNNPLVDNWQVELENLLKDKQDDFRAEDDYIPDDDVELEEDGEEDDE